MRRPRHGSCQCPDAEAPTRLADDGRAAARCRGLAGARGLLLAVRGMTSARRHRPLLCALAALAAGCGGALDKAPCANGHCGSQPVPSCDTGQSPCWKMMPGLCGPSSAGWAFTLDTPLDECVAGDTDLTVECLSCADPNDPACALPP